MWDAKQWRVSAQCLWMASEIGDRDSLVGCMGVHCAPLVISLLLLLLSRFSRVQLCATKNLKTTNKMIISTCACVRAQSFQSCLALCDPMGYSLPGSSVHGNSPDKHTGVGCHALLQGIFLTHGSNLHLLHLLHCRRVLYITRAT